MSQVDASAPERQKRGKAVHLSTLVGVVLGLAAGFFVFHTLASQWSEVQDDLKTAEWGWMVVGLVAAAFAMTAIASGWKDVLKLLHAEIPRLKVIAWYFVGELGKYLPGGVWPVLGRGELARRGGAPRSRAYQSVGMSLVTLYLAAMFVATLALPFSLAGGGPLGTEALFLLLLPLGLVMLHPKVLGWLLGVVRRVTKRDLPVLIPTWGQSVAIVARYIPAWIFVGASTWFVARAIDPSAPVAQVVFAAVLSWIAGFVAVPVPAGAGIREAVFIAASGLDPGIGATVAIATRVLFIIVDGGGAALSTPFLKHRQPILEDEVADDEVSDVGGFFDEPLDERSPETVDGPLGER